MTKMGPLARYNGELGSFYDISHNRLNSGNIRLGIAQRAEEKSSLWLEINLIFNVTHSKLQTRSRKHARLAAHFRHLTPRVGLFFFKFQGFCFKL